MQRSLIKSKKVISEHLDVILVVSFFDFHWGSCVVLELSVKEVTDN